MTPYQELTDLPGVGPSIAGDLRRLGITSVDRVATIDPERLYADLVELDGPTDRCVLYVFRCVQYATTTSDPDPDLLRWWRWKDSALDV